MSGTDSQSAPISSCQTYPWVDRQVKHKRSEAAATITIVGDFADHRYDIRRGAVPIVDMPTQHERVHLS
jgi:hypothetical protein